MISVFIDTTLIIRPVNPTRFIHIEFHFLEECLRCTWMNVHTRHVQYFRLGGFEDFFEVRDEIFLWHFIRVYMKDVIPGRDTFMIRWILTKVIKRASEHA